MPNKIVRKFHLITNIVTVTLLIAAFASVSTQAADGRLQGNPLETLPPAPPPPVQPGPMAAPAAPDQSAVSGILGRRVTPRYFDVSGVTAIPFDEVVALLEPLAGKDVSVADLVRETNRITELYKSHDYAISFALLQNQDFADGLVRVTVVEGHVNQVRIDGNAGSAEPRLHALAANIQAERPLTRATLERNLNLIRAVPGVSIRPDMALPQRADGSTELVLHVTARRPFTVDGGVADLGLGLQAVVTAGAHSLTPLGESTQVTAAIPIGDHHVEYYRGATSIPLNNDGLTLKLDAYRYRSKPEDAQLTLLGLKRQVNTDRASAMLSYPLWLNNNHALTLSGGFYATRSVDRYTRLDELASVAIHTDLRALQTGLSYTHASSRQRRSVEVNVHKGLDRFGAQQGSNSNYDLDFTRVTANLSQTVALPGGIGITATASGQYSNDHLASSERVSFGAWRFGLGYPAGEIAGDSGWGAALETNYTLRVGHNWLQTAQPYFRVDHARAYENNENAALLTNDRRLSSVALGLRLSDNRYYNFDLNVAKPVGDRPVNSGSRDIRFNANYSLRYN